LGWISLSFFSFRDYIFNFRKTEELTPTFEKFKAGYYFFFIYARSTGHFGGEYQPMAKTTS